MKIIKLTENSDASLTSPEKSNTKNTKKLEDIEEIELESTPNVTNEKTLP